MHLFTGTKLNEPLVSKPSSLFATTTVDILNTKSPKRFSLHLELPTLPNLNSYP